MFSKNIKFIVLPALLLAMVACGGGDKKGKKLETPNSPLTSQSDSLAYIIGVSMAQNLLEVDSMIDLSVVGTAIAQYGAGKSLFTEENAREAFLRYKLYIEPERQRSLERQYLKELAISERDYTLSRHGFIYNVVVIGDESLIPRNNGDWLEIDYTISRMDGGEELFSTYKTEERHKSGLSDLHTGMKEALKLIGKGGKITALIPSDLAYDDIGDETLGIAPFETLRYDIELVEIEKNGASKHAVTRDPATF
ncbi:MAG: FKBP-type peptidyl-prolyl cis-trans isomerase [Rikenellaceae bacterium]